MSEKGEIIINENAEEFTESRSLDVAEKRLQGVVKGSDLAKCMVGLIADVLSKKVSSSDASAVCQATGRVLKIAEMTYRYGTNNDIILVRNPD